MTRQEILEEVGRRLTNISTELATVLNATFPYVLGDLASRGAISFLHAEHTFSLGPAGTFSHNTRTITGLPSPHFPYQILSLIVAAWGYPGGLLQHTDSKTFDVIRVAFPDPGRPRVWRLAPNESTLELWPPVDSGHANAMCRIRYIKPPTLIADNEHITEIRFEDLDVLVNGILYWGIRYLPEESLEAHTMDRNAIRQLYEQGAARMAMNAARRLVPARTLLAMTLAGKERPPQ